MLAIKSPEEVRLMFEVEEFIGETTRIRRQFDDVLQARAYMARSCNKCELWSTVGLAVWHNIT